MGVVTAITLGLAAYSAYSSARGQLAAGRAAKQAGEAQEALGQFNAAVAEEQARDALLRGQDEESRFRSSVRQVIGSQRAGFAAQNVDVTDGSAREVQEDATYLGELDALTIRSNAMREAWGFRVAAENYRRGGAIAAAEGRAANTAAKWGAAGTILGSGYSLLAAKYGFGRKGA